MPEKMDFGRLQELLDDHQTGMSDFQDDYLVTLKAGGTLYGQYKQALRETYRRFRALRDLLYGDHGQKMLAIEIRKLESDLGSDEQDEFERERTAVRLQHRYLIWEESERAVADTYREFCRFYQQAQKLKEQVGPLTPEKRRLLEEGMWEYRVKEMAVEEILQTGRIGKRTLEFASVLPTATRDKVLHDLRSTPKDNLTDEYVSRNTDHLVQFETMELPAIDSGTIERQLFLNEGG